MTFDEKWMPKDHTKSRQINALAALRVNACDCNGFGQRLFFYVFRSAEGVPTNHKQRIVARPWAPRVIFSTILVLV